MRPVIVSPAYIPVKRLEGFTFVYVLECEGRSKIGLSDWPASRVTALQTGCPFEIKLHYSRQFPTRKSGQEAERGLHRLFDETRALGEWFTTAPEVVAASLAALPEPVEEKPVKRRGRPPLKQEPYEPPRKPKKDPWAEWDAQPEEVKMARLAQAAKSLEF